MEPPLKIVKPHDLRPGMFLQLRAGDSESAEIACIQGNQVIFTNGISLALEPYKDVAIFNSNYVPCQEPVNNIPTIKWYKPNMSETLWHKCRTPIFPRRTIDGSRTLYVGQVWRRKRNGEWEYRQDAETMGDCEDRQ